MEEERKALKEAVDALQDKSNETLWVQRDELGELNEEICQRRLELERAERV